MGQASEQYHALCSVCDQPMITGQAFNGLTKAHWTCDPAKPAQRSLGDIKTLMGSLVGRSELKAIKVTKPASKKEVIRFAWIEQYLREQQDKHSELSLSVSVDIVDSDFVCAYGDAHPDVLCAVQFVGAPSCPQLGKDLGRMCALGRLTRKAVGMPPGFASDGFPKWVYSYSLA